jgi:phospholipase/carboxylesterase
MPGRSWYAIDALNSRDAAGITTAAEAVLRWLDSAAASASSVALLGFSQGAAVALQALRLAPSRISAVVALSGYAAPGELPNDAALQGLRPPVFWGRGSRDDVIPPNLIDHTTQWLPAHAELSGRVYTGLTHSISEQELADVDLFLSQWKDALQG